MKFKVLLLTRYGRMGASSRLRALQFLPYLAERGFQVVSAPLLDDNYLKAVYAGQHWSWPRMCATWARRTWLMISARRFDVLWVEKECLPWIPAFVEQGLLPTGVPYLVDYDDATFHRYDNHRLGVVRSVLGGKIDAVMAGAAVVTVGNRYLAERARLAGAERIELLPTVIDVARYDPSPGKAKGVFTIGWIGSPTTTPYLLDVLGPIREVCKQVSARLVLVGATALSSADVPIQVLPWAEQTEADAIAQFDVGIMPLTDGPFERGKCGYKLIQYMASGVPVVASPVGVNAEIVEPGVNGFLAHSPAEWTEALLTLARDPQRAVAMGKNGLQKVKQQYDVSVTAPTLAALLGELASRRE